MLHLIRSVNIALEIYYILKSNFTFSGSSILLACHSEIVNFIQFGPSDAVQSPNSLLTRNKVHVYNHQF